MCFMKKAINLGFLVCLISICVTNIVAIQESAEKSNVTINIDTGDCGDSADCSEGAGNVMDDDEMVKLLICG